MYLYSSTLIHGVISVFVIAVLARSLTPESFGIVAIAQVLIQFNIAAGRSTFGKYIIRSSEKNLKNACNSSFFLNIVIASIYIAIIILFSDKISNYYQAEELKYVILILCGSFFLEQLYVVPISLLEKNLKFKSISYLKVLTNIISSSIAVYMALSGYGIYSLVFPNLIKSFLFLIGIYKLSKWRPNLYVNISDCKDILRFCLPILGSELLGAVNRNGDRLFLGKFLGLSVLGVYNISVNGSRIIRKSLIKPVSDVIYPSFNIQNKNEKNKILFIKYFKLISFLTLPIYIYLFLFREEFILTLYGSKWVDSIVPFSILLFIIFRKGFSTITSSILIINKKMHWQFYLNCISLIFYLAILIYISKFGLNIFCVALLIKNYVFSSIKIYLVRKLIGLSFSDFFKTQLDIIYTNLSLLISLLALKYFVNFENPIITLCFFAAFTILTYWLVNHLLKSKSYILALSLGSKIKILSPLCKTLLKKGVSNEKNTYL